MNSPIERKSPGPELKEASAFGRSVEGDPAKGTEKEESQLENVDSWCLEKRV